MSTLLLIESQDRMRAALADHLQRCGYEVAGVTDGLAAARWLQQHEAALLIACDGVPLGPWKTLRLLRLHPTRQTLPALVLGRRDGEADDNQRGEIECLSRPCSGEDLKKAVELSLQQQLRPISIDEARAEMAQMLRFPVMSDAHRKILALLGCEDDDVDIPNVTRTIESDVGLTTTILKVCSSAYYGFRGNSIDLAITFLGVEKIRSIVQTAIVFDVLASEAVCKGEDFRMIDLWKHCVACGVIMEEGGTRVKGRDHFIAGLLHDVGKILLFLRFPDHFAEILRMVREDGLSMFEAEYQLLGLCHTDVGYELARAWKLPPTIATCIAFHHAPGRALQHRRLSALVHLADISARMMGIGDAGDRLTPRMDEAARPLARYVMAVVERKEEIISRIDSMMVEFIPNAQTQKEMSHDHR